METTELWKIYKIKTNKRYESNWFVVFQNVKVSTYTFSKIDFLLNDSRLNFERKKKEDYNLYNIYQLLFIIPFPAYCPSKIK